MPKIIFDTATGSSNLGDFIIMDSVNTLANELLENDFLLHIPTHLHIHPMDLPLLRKYELAWVGGTNLLKNDQLWAAQWKIGWKEVPFLKKKAVLLGVGWWQYQHEEPSAYTQWFYKNILSRDYLHAVRDQYTKQQLERMGIRNVINTGCPTVWGLTAAHCSQIPGTKQDIVVTTITDYLRDPQQDQKILQILTENYREVYVWIQGSKDENYVRSLASGLKTIAPKLAAFDRFLEENECDYVGTRLHAGIRALQKKRRAIIIGIDNRAVEMRKDIGLPVLERAKIQDLKEWIHADKPTELQIDWASIAAWKGQFPGIR